MELFFQRTLPKVKAKGATELRGSCSRDKLTATSELHNQDRVKSSRQDLVMNNGYNLTSGLTLPSDSS